MFIQKRRIVAEDELMEEEMMDDTVAEEGEVEIDPEATDLLFEAEDVAELVAEVTGEPVEVTVDDDAVTFAIGDDEYTVEAEGSEEILEASKKVLKGKRRVSASTTRVPSKRRVAASKQSRASRSVRRVGRR